MAFVSCRIMSSPPYAALIAVIGAHTNVIMGEMTQGLSSVSVHYSTAAVKLASNGPEKMPLVTLSHCFVAFRRQLIRPRTQTHN